MHWAHAYIATARDVARPDSDAHAIFYAISQAICYIICYRHTHILAQPDGLAWVRALDLRRIIECTLNPLRLCHPGVTAVFTVVMRNAKVLRPWTRHPHAAHAAPVPPPPRRSVVVGSASVRLGRRWTVLQLWTRTRPRPHSRTAPTAKTDCTRTSPSTRTCCRVPIAT